MAVIKKPWVAAVVALILGPVLGAAYVNRGWLALVYLGVTVVIGASSYWVAQSGWIDVTQYGLKPMSFVNLMLIIPRIVGVFHCYRIAKRKDYPPVMRWYSKWYWWLVPFIVGVTFSFAFRTFVFEPFHIPGTSMSPGLKYGDLIVAKKFAYNSRLPERGDLIVFKAKDYNYVKRIVGLPGDRVQIRNNLLYINDVQVPRKRVEDYVLRIEGQEWGMQQYIETLPEGKEYRVIEERVSAAVDDSPIYTVPEGHYFGIGDYRRQAYDIVVQQSIDFIALENIKGEVGLLKLGE